MKLTLLGLTQNILSALNSDEVNSISDTTESRQVAEIIKTCYFNIVTRAGIPEQFKLFHLDSSTDPDMPVVMYKPSNVTNISWIKYFKVPTEFDEQKETFEHDLDTDIVETDTEEAQTGPNYQDVYSMQIKPFIDMVTNFNPNEAITR